MSPNTQSLASRLAPGMPVSFCWLVGHSTTLTFLVPSGTFGDLLTFLLVSPCHEVCGLDILIVIIHDVKMNE